MKLGGKKLEEVFKNGDWKMFRDGDRVEEPVCGPNSNDVSLAKHFLTPMSTTHIIDPTTDDHHWIEEDCEQIVLNPRQMILGCTRERFNCSCPIPICTSYTRGSAIGQFKRRAYFALYCYRTL